jgi:hypothetical protein
LAVVSVNQAIETKDRDLLMKTLQHPRSQLPQVHDFAGSLYMEEFCSMREEKENEEQLDYDEIYAAVGGNIFSLKHKYCNLTYVNRYSFVAFFFFSLILNNF